jgi:hypothetical protein
MNPDGTPVVFNQADPKLQGFVAVSSGLGQPTMELIRKVRD